MRYILLFFLLVSLNSYSQLKSYIIGVKGDTLNKVDSKGMKQGKWVVHYDGVRSEPGYEEEGIYINNRKEGGWRLYSLDGDLAVGLIGGDHVIRGSVGSPLQCEQSAVGEAVTAREARLEQLGAQVVVVEHEPGALGEPERQADWPEDIRRVARLNHIESLSLDFFTGARSGMPAEASIVHLSFRIRLQVRIVQ